MGIVIAPDGPPEKGRLAVFDALRGIAAICVVLLHRESIAGTPGLFTRSYLAVDFFFMLSGFVMVRQIETNQSVVVIMRVRIRRFLPLMTLGTLLGLLAHLSLANPAEALIALLPSLLCIPPAFLALGFPLNGPQWSLLIELIANLGHALGLRHCKKSVLLTISAASWCALIAAADQASGLNITGANAWPNALLRGCFAYPLGCFLGRCHATKRARSAMPWWLAPLLLLVVLLGPGLLDVPIHFSDPAALACFVPILLLAATARPSPYVAMRSSWLGALSFPLYIVHFPLLEIGRWFAEHMPTGWHAIPQLLALAAAFALAQVLSGSPAFSRTPIFSGTRPHTGNSSRP